VRPDRFAPTQAQLERTLSLRNGHRLWVGLGIVAASTIFGIVNRDQF
jgi:hypothetical protein